LAGNLKLPHEKMLQTACRVVYNLYTYLMNIRAIQVTAIGGARHGQSGSVSTWPVPALGINVLWDDGTITAARPGEISVPDEAAQLARHAAVEARIGELSRKSRTKLLLIMTEVARQRGASWVVGGPGTWSKDELINGILEFEFAPKKATENK
jgi:hypothetical protein